MVFEAGMAMLALDDNKRMFEQAQPGLFGDAGIFDEEIKRMKRYDSTMLPEHYRPIAEAGWKTALPLPRGGDVQYAQSDRVFKDATKLIALAVERTVFVAYEDNETEMELSVHLPFTTMRLPGSLEEELRSGRTIAQAREGSVDTLCLRIRDQGPLGTPVYCIIPSSAHYSDKCPVICLEPSYQAGHLLNGRHKVVRIGEMPMPEGKPDLITVGLRRFTYAFGQLPVSIDDITTSLVSLNKFPRTRNGDRL
jgi:hypothetical protein